MTAAYFILAAALLLWAWHRQRSVCAATLIVALGASCAVWILHPWSVIPFAAAIDAMVCLTMMAVWPNGPLNHARAICFVGVGKTIASLMQYSTSAADISWSYALAINMGFVMQVLIAGGFLDAMGVRACDLLGSRCPIVLRVLFGDEGDAAAKVTRDG